MEGENDPSIVAVVPTSFGSDFILRSVYPTPSSEFSFSLELEGNNAASTVVAFPPSSAFSFSFAVKLEGGTAPSSVVVAPPSFGSTALLISVYPASSSGFTFLFQL